MPTLKAVITKSHRNKDGLWRVSIRLTQNRVSRYIATDVYVSRKDLTPKFDIKNSGVLLRLSRIIDGYREKLLHLPTNIVYSADEMVRYLTMPVHAVEIDFVKFATEWCSKHTEIKGIKNYACAIHSLQRFFGSDAIPMSSVTVKTMRDYDASLASTPRARSLYENHIIRMFNAAREYYNDEDNGVIRIRHSLASFHPTRQRIAPVKRALDVEIIRRIAATSFPEGSRTELSRDCFLLSFMLMGMNAVDMFEAVEFDGSYLIYNRAKTRDRRADAALIKVKILPQAQELFAKYRDTERVFIFHRRYSSPTDFSRALNIGLKDVGKAVGIERLTFYAARHSMATIAVNDCRISKYVVNDMLNHSDPALRITEIYIKRDFSAINDANSMLLDFVFGQQKTADPHGQAEKQQ